MIETKGAFGKKDMTLVAGRPHICRKCKNYEQPKCVVTDKFTKRTNSCSEWSDKYGQ